MSEALSRLHLLFYTQATRSKTELFVECPDVPAVDGWETVTRSDQSRGHRRHQRQRQQCTKGIRCGKAGDCAHRHTPEEERIFRDTWAGI